MQGPSGGQVSALSILWISTYQFMVGYKNESDPDSRPGLFLAQGSKAGPTTFTNFEDICYSTGEHRLPYFALMQQQEWGTIFCASSNSMEIGVLGSVQGPDPIRWADFGRS
jgi:hypothetical protein